MRRTKTQKGITLVALIITIIVLLILAVVAIGAVQNDGIINHAKNARDKYQEAQANEQTLLNSYLDILNENNPNNVKWTQNGTVVTSSAGDKINVGDTVNYVSNADTVTVDEESWEETTKKYETELGGTWKVLGAENGEILIMSTQSIYSPMEIMYLSGPEAYLTGVSQLNTICEPYGNGEYASKTTKARSITVEDVNRVTGFNPRNIGVYDPLQTGKGTKYNQGKIYEYGNIVTYTFEDGILYYSGTNEVSGDDDGMMGGLL